MARGSASVRKIAEEGRAGVRYFDVHMGGSESIVSGLLPERILAPVADAGERAGAVLARKLLGQ